MARITGEQFGRLCRLADAPSTLPRWEVPAGHRVVIVRRDGRGDLRAEVPATQAAADRVALAPGPLLWFAVPEPGLAELGLAD